MSFTVEAMKVVGIAISNIWIKLNNVVDLWHFLFVGFTTHMTTTWLMPFRSVNVLLYAIISFIDAQ